MKNQSFTRIIALTATALSTSALGLLANPALAADVTPQRLENADAEPQNWLMGFQNYSSHRFSRLDEINQSNVGDLRVVFTMPITTGLRGRNDVQMENYGLVDDGFMYLDDAGGIFYKIDLTSGTRGTTVWRADAALPRDIRARSRGITMLGNAIFHNLPASRLH